MAGRVRTIAICHPQVPFFRGGAELAAEGLRDALRSRGYEAELVSVPFRWYPRVEIARSCLAWRLLDLRESNGRRIDRVIATKFPSYAVRHDCKVTWLFHQLRQAYDLFGTPYSDFTDTPEDRAVRQQLARIDAVTLGESRRVFTLSETVARRLRRWNDIEGTPLYHPPPGHERYHAGVSGDYVLYVGRLDPLKRAGPLIEALPHTDRSLRAVLVGSGPEEAPLRARARALGVEDRVVFRAGLPLDELVKLYSDCLAVYYAPFEEDYGFVTLEAFLSHKPVLTAPDAGGPTEFVEDGVTGLVCGLEPEALGAALRRLDQDRGLAAELGAAGHARAARISWDEVVTRLVAA